MCYGVWKVGEICMLASKLASDYFLIINPFFLRAIFLATSLTFSVYRRRWHTPESKDKRTTVSCTSYALHFMLNKYNYLQLACTVYFLLSIAHTDTPYADVKNNHKSRLADKTLYSQSLYPHSFFHLTLTRILGSGFWESTQRTHTCACVWCGAEALQNKVTFVTDTHTRCEQSVDGFAFI